MLSFYNTYLGTYSKGTAHQEVQFQSQAVHF